MVTSGVGQRHDGALWLIGESALQDSALPRALPVTVRMGAAQIELSSKYLSGE